jgi:hypothetical protein
MYPEQGRAEKRKQRLSFEKYCLSFWLEELRKTA